jgi:hypothetical protein
MTAHTFDENIVSAILTHMNHDHRDDNLLIARAMVAPDAEAATMTGLDGSAGMWNVTVDGDEREVRIPWSVPITERAEVRREIVVLYEAACARLGVASRNH